MNEIIREDLENICTSGLDWEKFKDSTVLISGAYGMLPLYMVFVLMHLNDIRPELNIKVLALCRNPEKAKKRFADFLNSPLFQVICADVVDKLKIKEKIDYIIHAASPASSQFYGSDPINVITPNILGTYNLLELAREKKSKGFLFFSSGEVCGAVNKNIISEEDSGYLDSMDVRSCYGESKRMGENMCKCWHYQYKIPTFVVRPEHTYGPAMDLEIDKRVFAEFVSNIVNGQDIVLKSDGLACRTFCYISDATEGFFRVLLKGNPGESYNVGNKDGQMAIGKLAHLLVSLFPEKKLKVVYASRDNNSFYLENKDKIRPVLSTAKIEKIGYRCRFSVKDGFLRTIKSFLKGGGV
ncbi:MAG: NAD-dependent epimerase/dehydratase family protein [Candidatus Omnitrophota bacterium]